MIIYKYRGILFALLSAASFALNLVLASISYEFGANVHALNVSRSSCFLALLLVLVIKRSNLRELASARILMPGIVGIFLTLEMYALLVSIQLIPVAISVLVFYVYPIIIALFGWTVGRQTFKPQQFVYLLVAVFGIGMILTNGLQGAAIEGVMFAGIAAFGMAAMLLCSEHFLAKTDQYIVMFVSLLTATIIIIAISTLWFELHWPTTFIGVLAFCGSALFYVLATLFLFKAVGLIGPLRTAIIDNSAPVWAGLFGYVLLGETLTLQQLVGISIVVSAILLLQLTISKPNESATDNPIA